MPTIHPDQQPAPRHDLSDAVTVFVTTVGAPTFERCLRHLREQDCTFRLEIIDYVAPMNVAFQRMLDGCRTRYYVQVDEDMILHPHAVRTLYETIEAAGPGVALFVGELYDVHLQRCIHGVKIFRHELVRGHPLAACRAFELEQIAQLERAGHQIVMTVCGPRPVQGRTLGLHGTQWTPRSVYERYGTLERSRRARPSRPQWFAEYGAEFLRRFSEDPSEQNFYAIMGVIAGVIASRNGEAGAKDYRKYDLLPGFDALQQFLEEVRTGAAQRPRERSSAARPKARAGRRKNVQR